MLDACLGENRKYPCSNENTILEKSLPQADAPDKFVVRTNVRCLEKSVPGCATALDKGLVPK